MGLSSRLAVACLTLSLLACKEDAKAPPPAERVEPVGEAEPVDDPPTPAEAPEPVALAPRDPPITPEGCVRVDGAWRCVAPGVDPPAADVVDVVTSEDLRCELHASGLLRCEQDEGPFEFSGIETLAVSKYKLALSRQDSPRQALSPLSSDRAKLFEIDDRYDVIALGIGWRSCTLTRDATLRCDSERFDAVEDFAVGLSSACRVSGGALTCWTEHTRMLGPDSALERTYTELPPVARVHVVPGVSCVRTTAGTVWCWGGNERGELGQDRDLRHSFDPLEVPGLSGVVSMRLFDRYACALLESGELRCWGEVPARIAAVTAIPEPVFDGCPSMTLDGWAELLRASASDAKRVKSLLRQAGLLVDAKYLSGSREPGATLELDVEVTPVEMDGRPPIEALVEVRLRVAGRDPRVLAAVFVEDEDKEDGKRCPVGAEQLSAGIDPPAHDPLPSDPAFSDPAELELIELLAPGRFAISRRLGVGSDGSDPLETTYVQSFFMLEAGELREVSGPHTLYETMTSSFVDGATITGSVELGDEFPRAIHRRETTDCAPLRASCERNPEACAQLDTDCEDGVATTSWTWVDGRYRRDR